MRPEQIPYGVKDFKRIRLEDFYYVDKTAFIRKLEDRANFLFFVRPRRFGKSLLCETLRCYYDVAEKGNFDRLFGGLDIGKDPTANASRYFVLSLDFSYVNASRGETWSAKFENYLNNALRNLIDGHRVELSAVADVDELIALPGAGDKFDVVVPLIKRLGYGLYVIVVEYDNFTNEIVSTAGKLPYKEITHGTGFYRGWFKKFKGTCDRIFMTGVSPVTMDDLTSGFNIATNITQEEGFNAMVGFTAAETRRLFEDFQGTGRFADAAESHLRTVKAWYDSYCFSKPCAGRETLYNCDMALYYLGKLVASGRPPENLVDANIRSDWNKLRAILAAPRRTRACCRSRRSWRTGARSRSRSSRASSSRGSSRRRTSSRSTTTTASSRCRGSGAATCSSASRTSACGGRSSTTCAKSTGSARTRWTRRSSRRSSTPSRGTASGATSSPTSRRSTATTARRATVSTGRRGSTATCART